MESPCINICKLDKAGRICTGCRRTIDEIQRWRGTSKAERRAIMERLGRQRETKPPLTDPAPP